MSRSTWRNILKILLYFVAVFTPDGEVHSHNMSIEGCQSPHNLLVVQFIAQTLDRINLPAGPLQFRMYQELETVLYGDFRVSLFYVFLSIPFYIGFAWVM